MEIWNKILLSAPYIVPANFPSRMDGKNEPVCYLLVSLETAIFWHTLILKSRTLKDQFPLEDLITESHLLFYKNMCDHKVCPVEYILTHLQMEKTRQTYHHSCDLNKGQSPLPVPTENTRSWSYLTCELEARSRKKRGLIQVCLPVPTLTSQWKVVSPNPTGRSTSKCYHQRNKTSRIIFTQR